MSLREAGVRDTGVWCRGKRKDIPRPDTVASAAVVLLAIRGLSQESETSTTTPQEGTMARAYPLDAKCWASRPRKMAANGKDVSKSREPSKVKKTYPGLPRLIRYTALKAVKVSSRCRAFERRGTGLPQYHIPSHPVLVPPTRASTSSLMPGHASKAIRCTPIWCFLRGRTRGVDDSEGGEWAAGTAMSSWVSFRPNFRLFRNCTYPCFLLQFDLGGGSHVVKWSL